MLHALFVFVCSVLDLFGDTNILTNISISICQPLSLPSQGCTGNLGYWQQARSQGSTKALALKAMHINVKFDISRIHDRFKRQCTMWLFLGSAQGRAAQYDLDVQRVVV